MRTRRACPSRGAFGGATAVLAAALATAAVPRDAAAQDRGGVYGRLRADAALSFELGAGLAVTATDARPAFAGTLRARALDMAGIFAGYQYAVAVAPGAGRYDAVVLGADLRPVMLARIFSDLESGPQRLDLTLDSIGLEMGVALVRPGEPWGAGSGLGFVLGTGVDVPLAWSQGTGLMLRFSARWIHATDWDTQRPGVGPASGESFLLAVNLVGRTTARLGLVGGY